MKLDLSSLRDLAVSVGFPDPDLAAAVAMAESGGDSCARGDPHESPDCNDPGTSNSLGLWQIDMAYHPEYRGNPTALFDPTTNAQAAYAISSGGTNWQPWSTYNSGAYKAHYQPAATSTGADSGTRRFPWGTVLGVIGIIGVSGGVAYWLTSRPAKSGARRPSLATSNPAKKKRAAPLVPSDATVYRLGKDWVAEIHDGVRVGLYPTRAAAIEAARERLGLAKPPEKPKGVSERPPMNVQSVLVPASWKAETALAWVEDHGFSAKKVDTTARFYRFRQQDPGKFKVLRTVSFGDSGVKAVVGRAA